MRIDNVSFPYPVLGVSDDIRPTLSESGCDVPDITVREVNDMFSVEVCLKLEDDDILKYIADGFAEFSVEVSCKTTKFRKCMVSSLPNFSFEVKRNLFNGKIEFDSFVIAKKNIDNYQNDGLNPDYEGHVINLHKGDLLVAYKKCSIPVNLDLRNVHNMRSFIQIKRNTRPDVHTVRYDLSTSKILIFLPDELMDEYNKKPKNDAEKEKERKAILKASLYLEALVYALLNYRANKGRDDLMWVNALSYRMHEPDIIDFCRPILGEDEQMVDEPDMDDLFKLAHIMLNQPYLNMLKYVSAKNEVGQIFMED